MTEQGVGAHPPGFRIRTAGPEDLAACHDLWRDGLNDYLERQGRVGIPKENPGLTRLHAHTMATDPDLFAIAEGADGVPLGFGSAVRRDRLWFLSMLFIRPGVQTSGIGRAILEHLLPGPAEADLVLGTAADSGQPISNGLYAAYGIPPRIPLFNLVGRVERPEALEPLPAGIDAAAGEGAPPEDAEVEALDREVLGFTRPQDHAFLRAEGRTRFVYRDGAGSLVGYGYTSALGRVSAVTVHTSDLLAPVLGHLLTVIEPRGASATWAAGDSPEVFRSLVRAGLRIDDLPINLCWSTPFADWSRAIPISPGLL